jgi:uncharacterized DUF497 family protein
VYIITLRYEWDERKRLSNLEKHGLDFFDVGIVFESSYQVAFEGALRWRRGADAGVRKYVKERDEETTKVSRRRQLGITC